MASPFCQPLIVRPAAQNWTVVRVRRAAHAVMTSVIPTTIRKRVRVMLILYFPWPARWRTFSARGSKTRVAWRM